LLEIQSQARRYVKIAVLSRRRPRGRRPDVRRELSAETKETMPVIYVNGEIITTGMGNVADGQMSVPSA
jgi:hypothetical protein